MVLFILVAIAFFVMVPSYSASRDALDRQLYGLKTHSSDPQASELQTLQFPREQIRRSRLAGAAGVLMIFTLNEVAALLEGANLIEMFMRIHAGTAILPLSLLAGWVIGRAFYFSRAARRDLPLPDRSELDLLHLDNLYAIGRTGLRHALVPLFAIAIGGLILLDTEFGLWGAIPLFATGLGVGLVQSMRPARQVRALTGDASMQGRLTDLMADSPGGSILDEDFTGRT